MLHIKKLMRKYLVRSQTLHQQPDEAKSKKR